MLLKILLIILIILFLILALIGIYVFRFAIVRNPQTPMQPPKENAPKVYRDYYEHKETQLDWLHKWGYETVFITNERGARLAGYYFTAKKPTNQTVLAVHGYRSNAFDEYLYMAKMYLEDLEMNLLIVDDYAHGQSEGKNIGFGYFDRYDVHSWCQWLIEQNENTEILLQGISMGAATVIMAAGDPLLSPRVSGVVADCSFSSLRKEMHYILTKLMKLPFFPLYPLGSLVCQLVAGYSFNDPVPLNAAPDIQVPILFIHGTSDSYILPAHMEELYAATNSDKKKIYVTGAPHAHSYLTNPAEYLAGVKDLLVRIDHLKK